jgi:hypothetical protein
LGISASAQRRALLRSEIEAIRSLAALDLDELVEQGDVLGLGEAGDGGSLAFMPRPERPRLWVETR